MTLHTKYRPTCFDEVIGQHDAVEAIKSVLEKGTSRAFLLSGPAGLGKTTLARIIAHEVGCDEMGVSEIDGATHTGVDNMRKVAEAAQYRSLSGGRKCYIIDECHMLSRNTWNSMLKIVEEPPEHVFWIFCTTEPSKVPPTIVSRCISIKLQLLMPEEIEKLLHKVCEAEGEDVSEEIIALCARTAKGSPRQGLVDFSKCIDVPDLDTARALLSESTGPKDAFQLAQCIFQHGDYFPGKKNGGFTLHNLQGILGDLKETSPESVRIVVFAYATSVLIKAKTKAVADRASHVLGSFQQEALEQNKIGDIAVRCMRLLHVFSSR